MKRILTTLFLVLSLSGVLTAGDGIAGDDTRKSQEFPFKFGPMGLSTMMQQAGLSDAQMRQLHEIFQSQRLTIQQQRDDVEAKETALQTLLDSPQVDWVQAERVLDEMLDARKVLARTTTMLMVRGRQVVTFEQWRKIAELQRSLPQPTPKPELHDKKPQ